MKKIIAMIFMSLMMISFAFAANGTPNAVPTLYDNNISDNATLNQLQNQLKNVMQNATQIRAQIRENIKNGSFQLRDGKMLQLRNGMTGVVLESKNVMAKTKLQLMNEANGTQARIRTMLSNGRNATIKIMPNVASENAIRALKMRMCKLEDNCSIELKEVVRKGEPKAAYRIMAQKHSKLFGLFKAKMNVEADVDAETGEILNTKKPWWAFLASESSEQEAVIAPAEKDDASDDLQCPDADGYYDEDCPSVKDLEYD